jgi:hypothetical protein
LVSKLQHQNARLSVIEEKLDITPPNHELIPHEQSVLDNINPMQEDPVEVVPSNQPLQTLPLTLMIPSIPSSFFQPSQ